MEVSHECIQGSRQEQECESRKKSAPIKWSQWLLSLSSRFPLQWDRNLQSYPIESDEGEQCSWRASSMCFILGSEMTFAERWNWWFLCAVSCLWTLKLPSALPNLNPGIKLPFATTSHLSWQFRQLTTWWSILLSGLCCKMRNWEQFCCTLD